MTSHPVRGAALLSLSLVLCCSETEAPAPARPAAAPEAALASSPSTRPSLRLLDRLAQATVDCPVAESLEGELPAPTPAELVLDERPVDAEGWFEGCWERARARGREARSYLRTTEEETPRLLALFTASRGLHRLIPSDGDEALEVRARVRALGEQPPTLSVQSLTDRPPSTLDREAGVPELAVLPARPNRPARSDPGPATTEWTELRVHVPREATRRGLRISLVGPDQGVLIDRVSVRRLGLVADRILDGSLRGSGSEALRTRRAADGRSNECLALPGGTVATFDLALPGGPLRLDTSLHVETLGDAAAVAVECRVDGRLLGTVQGGDEAWIPWRLPLDEGAGREVEFELRVSPGDHIAYLAAPWILGPAPRSRPNLVLLSIDTLRADHVGCYGATEDPTPNLDAFAAQGTRFARALSPSSYTLPAHASLMTGQHPLVHGTLVQPHRLQPARSPLLARSLRDAGHRTAAFTGGGFLIPAFGFAEGFETFDHRDPGGVDARGLAHDPQRHVHPPGSHESVRAALEPSLDFLRRHHDQPFFLFFHTYFVHNYVADPDYTAGSEAIAAGAEQPFQELWDRATAGDELAVRCLEERYRATVRQADAEILRPLLDELHTLGLDENTLVVLVSDHGEEFQEHGTLGHGRRLWNTLVEVPMVFRGPGVPASVSSEPASLVDVSRTVRDLLGLDGDERLQGRSLFDQAPSEPLLLHLANRDARGRYDWDALVDGPWKLLRHHPGEGAPIESWLFHEDDPGELSDRSAQEAAQLEQLRERLDQRVSVHLEQFAKLPRADEDADLDDGLRDMLERLGYSEPEDPPGPDEGARAGEEQAARQDGDSGAPK